MKLLSIEGKHWRYYTTCTVTCALQLQIKSNNKLLVGDVFFFCHIVLTDMSDFQGFNIWHHSHTRILSCDMQTLANEKMCYIIIALEYWMFTYILFLLINFYYISHLHFWCQDLIFLKKTQKIYHSLLVFTYTHLFMT